MTKTRLEELNALQLVPTNLPKLAEGIGELTEALEAAYKALDKISCTRGRDSKSEHSYCIAVAMDAIATWENS